MAKLWIEGGSVEMFLPIEEPVSYGNSAPRVFCLDSEPLASPKYTKRERFRVASVRLEPGVELVDVATHVSKTEAARFAPFLKSPRKIVIVLEEIRLVAPDPPKPKLKKKKKGKGKK